MPKKANIVVADEVTELSLDDLNKLPHIAEEEVANSIDELTNAFNGLVEFEGSPFDVVKKDVLVGVPFAIADIRFYKGSYGTACAVLCVTEDGRKLVFNDGSTGVYRQCLAMVKKYGRRGGFFCPKGLRAHTYDWVEKDFDGNPIGEPRKATTYYVA